MFNGIAILIGVFIVIAIVVWLIVNVVVPLAFLNSATLLTLGAIFSKRLRRPLAGAALCGAGYLILDVSNGWLADDFVRNVVGKREWITAFVLLNALASGISASILARPLWDEALELLASSSEASRKGGIRKQVLFLGVVLIAVGLLPSLYFAIPNSLRSDDAKGMPGVTAGSGVTAAQVAHENSANQPTAGSPTDLADGQLDGGADDFSESQDRESGALAPADSRILPVVEPIDEAADTQRGNQKAAESRQAAGKPVRRASHSRPADSSTPIGEAAGHLAAAGEKAADNDGRDTGEVVRTVEGADDETAIEGVDPQSTTEPIVEQFNEANDLIARIERLSKQAKRSHEEAGREGDEVWRALDGFASAVRDTRRTFRKATGTGLRGLASNLTNAIRREKGSRDVDSRIVEIGVQGLLRRADEIQGLHDRSPLDSTTSEYWKELRSDLARLSELIGG